MKVRMLISKLQKLEKDTHIMLRGYEGGYSDIKCVRAIKIDRNVNMEGYNGPHDDGDQEKVFLIEREANPNDKE